MSDEHIAGMNEGEYKKLISGKVREAALTDLRNLQDGNSKVNQNFYNGLQKPTEYLLNRKISYRQASIMFALRSGTLRGIKNNFKKMNSENTLCWVCERSEDTQEHVICYSVLLNILPQKKPIEYNHTNGTGEQQIEFIKKYERYVERRDELQEDPNEGPVYQDFMLAPCAPRLDLHDCQGGAMKHSQLDSPVFVFH